MLIIPSINNIYTNKLQSRNDSSSRFSFGVGKLAPLTRDTVSFTGGKKNLDYNNDEEVPGGINKTTAKQIHEEAKRTSIYLEQKLDKILGDLVRPTSGKGSLSKPIEVIRVRPKTPDSIVEKSKTRRLNNIKEVKEGMTDIVGARIVMADTSKEAVDNIIYRFTNAVKHDEIKILEIENYRPDPELDTDDNIIKSYDYGSAKALKELKLTCNDKLGTSIRKVDEDVPSGYMAIHMLVQLPNGFTGEIQIIGNEVERLKDIEDICFKTKNGKSVKDIPARVKKMLEPLTNRDDVILRKEHNIYTRQAYIYQRELEMDNQYGRKKSNNEFLHIPEYLPKTLDFNNIAAKLEECGVVLH